MTLVEELMLALESCDYSKFPEEKKHILHLMIMRDRLAYFSCQLVPFHKQPPFDLPIVIGKEKFGPAKISMLKCEDGEAVKFYELLSAIEEHLLDAADLRGICLQRRPVDSASETPGGGANILSKPGKNVR